MTAPGFRCSLAALDLGEPMVGTASTVRAFLLVEAPGSWGVDAVTGARLPSEVRSLLSTLARRHGVRVLMIRDHRRRTPETVRVFAAYVAADRPWVETAELADLRELLDLRLAGLGAGESPGMTAHDAPLFLVCTHGKHDACCAERGRPLCRAMHDVAPEHTWEVSHIGGDRFAGNALVLPYGLYLGRLEAGSAVAAAAAAHPEAAACARAARGSSDGASETHTAIVTATVVATRGQRRASESTPASAAADAASALIAPPTAPPRPTSTPRPRTAAVTREPVPRRVAATN